MKRLVITLIAIASMGMGETAVPNAEVVASAPPSPSASPVPEVPYDCKRWPPKTRRWKTFGYSICMNGPGWQRVRIRCFHPQAGEIYIVHGLYVRSHQINPDNDLSIEWCPRGSYARRVRIQKLPNFNFELRLA